MLNYFRYFALQSIRENYYLEKVKRFVRVNVSQLLNIVRGLNAVNFIKIKKPKKLFDNDINNVIK
jgi:hypothetical protein